MNNNYFIFIASLVALTLTIGCTKEEGIPQNTIDEGTGSIAIPATISVSIPEEGLTKVTMEQDTNPDGIVKLKWDDEDAITVKNAADESKSVAFSYKSGAGAATATFYAADISALAGATSYNVYLDSKVPADYNVQAQASDGSTSHLGYSVKLGGVNKYDGATFSEDWATAAANGSGTFTSSSVLRIRAQMPTAAIADAIQAVIVKADKDIFNGKDSIRVEITTPGVAGDGKVVTVYATLPAGAVNEATTTKLLFQFQKSDNKNDRLSAYREVATLSINNGEVNAFKINCPNIASYANPDNTNIGQSTNPYLIGDRNQLAAISSELSTTEKKYFKLVDDIKVSNWTSIDCNTKGAIDLDGNGKTISGLNKPLFEFFNGKVSDLTLSNATVSATGSNYYGVLARTVDGANSCELTNVSVINSSVTAKGTIGGLVGKIDSSTPCTLTNCSAEVDVIGTGYYLGGLVGQVTNGTLTHCSATGDVSTSTYYASGLVGFIHGTVTIEKCYATGDIKPTVDNTVANTGGIVGYLDASADLTILNCYYTGTIGTDTYKHRRWSGGLLGRTEGSTVSITNCYASFSVKTSNANVDGAWVGNSGSSSVTCSGYVSWSSITKMAGTGTAVSADGNYLGTSGTIKSQAEALGGWDFSTVWTTDDTPLLRPYVAP